MVSQPIGFRTGVAHGRNAQQSIPAPGVGPDALANGGCFIVALDVQYDTALSAASKVYYFRLSTSADGHDIVVEHLGRPSDAEMPPRRGLTGPIRVIGNT